MAEAGKKNRTGRTILVIFAVIAGIIIISAATIFGIGYGMYKRAVSALPAEQVYLTASSQEGYVTLDRISPDLQAAVIAIEDHRFYSHPGYDIRSMCRAAVDSIITGNLTGGSTITQQTAKNVWFTQEKRFTRKAAEIFAARDLERVLGKEKILELYLNISFFGKGSYGIGAAAREFFGTTPDKLTLEQSVYLAGLLQAPSVYSANEEKAAQRYEKVVNAMKRYNMYPSD